MNTLTRKQQLKRTILLLTHGERVMREVALKPKVCFNMSRWGRKWNPFTEEGAPPCGTTACAAGWMGLDPQMRSMGITTELDERDSHSLRIQFNEIVNWRYHGTFENLRVFFGITAQEVDNLFDNGSEFYEYNRSPITKANQIAWLRKMYELELENIK